MSRFLLGLISKVVLAVSLWLVTAPTVATAQTGLGNIGGDHLGLEVGAAIAGVGVGIGVGVYFIVRQPRVTGCVGSSADGSLTLQGKNTGDPVYVLQGETGTLTAGSRVKVVGRRKKDAGKGQLLVVSRVAKKYGACSLPAVTHAGVATPALETSPALAMSTGLGEAQLVAVP